MMLQSVYRIDYIIKEHPIQKYFKGGFSYYLKKVSEYLLHPRKFYIRYKADRSYIEF